MARPGHNKNRRSRTREELIERTVDPNDPRFNTALARGIAVLRAFELDEQFLGNADIARRTGVPKATISRLTHTLTELGYLSYRDDLGKYEIAPGVLGLAYPYLANMPVPAIARPLMSELARATETNVGLVVLDGLSAVYLENALGEPNMNRRQRVGFRIPIARTATGRACIAAMSREDRDRTLERLREAHPRDWDVLREEIDEAISQVRVRGYCIGASTYDPLTAMVGVPFPYQDGRLILAFNCGGHAKVHTAKKLAQYGVRLVELARAVRRELG